MSDSQTKRCIECKQVKSLEEFPKRADSKDGYRNQCKECVTIKQRIYNEGKGKEVRRKYWASPAGKLVQKRYKQKPEARALQRKRDSKRKAYKTNLERQPHIKATRKRYRQTEAGRECFRKIGKRQRDKFPEKARAHKAVKAAVASGTLPQISTQICQTCGAQAQDYHHHINYLPENWLNVTPLCKQCHVKEHPRS